MSVHDNTRRLAVSVGALLLLACSANSSTTGGGFDSEANSTGGIPGAIDPPPQGPPDLTPESACAEESQTAGLVPLNIYLLIDTSGSMNDSPPGPLPGLPNGPAKWKRVEAGVSAFIADPDAAGLRVAASHFPQGAANSSCEQGQYALPSIDFAPLDGDPAPGDVHEQALVQWLSSLDPSGPTPMAGALAGTYQHTRAHLQSHPKEKGIVILVTDGSPTTCPDNSIAHIAGLAAEQTTKSNPIRTFTIGIEGSQEAELKAIAFAGQGSAYFFGKSSNLAQDVLNTLKTITHQQLGCEFAIPDPQSGAIDPHKVNVNFTDAAGKSSALYRVDGPEHCIAGAWYYAMASDGAAPTKVILCPQTCATARDQDTAALQILYGCPSKLPR